MTANFGQGDYVIDYLIGRWPTESGVVVDRGTLFKIERTQPLSEKDESLVSLLWSLLRINHN